MGVRGAVGCVNGRKRGREDTHLIREQLIAIGIESKLFRTWSLVERSGVASFLLRALQV